MSPLLAALVALGLPSGALLVETGIQTEVRFVPVDGGPPRRIAPESGLGYGRGPGSARVLAVHPATGGVLLGWQPSRAGSEAQDLFWVDVKGRFVNGVVHVLDGASASAEPVFSPDGHAILAATATEVSEFDLLHAGTVVLGRIPPPAADRRLSMIMRLDWSTATPAVEVAEIGAALLWRTLDRTGRGVDILAHPTGPRPGPQLDERRLMRITGSRDLVVTPRDSPRTVHRVAADGSVGKALVELEVESPLHGLRAIEGTDILTWYRGRSLVARDFGPDAVSIERVLLPDVRDGTTRATTTGLRPCVILARASPLPLLAVPVDGSPPVDLSIAASDGPVFGVADGVVTHREHRFTRLLVSAGDEPPRAVTPDLPGDILYDDWSPGRTHYVWQMSAADATESEVWTWAVGEPSAQRVATDGAGIGGFAAGYLLVDRSPETAPQQVRLDTGAASLRASGLPRGMFALVGRSEPPAWLGLSRTGELLVAPIETDRPGDSRVLATGLSPEFGLAVSGTRAVVFQGVTGGGGRIAAVETVGPGAGQVTPLSPEMDGWLLTPHLDPLAGRLFVRAHPRVFGAPVRWFAVPLDGSSAHEMPDLAPPPAAWLLEDDATTPATNATGDAALLSDPKNGLSLWRTGRPDTLLAAVLPGPAPDPQHWDRWDARQPRVLGWPGLGPTGGVLMTRGPALLLADTNAATPLLRPIAKSSEKMMSAGWRWSPDGSTLAGANGRALFFLDVARAKVLQVPLDPGVRQISVEGDQPDGAAVLIMATRAEGNELLRVLNRGAGRPVKLLRALHTDVRLVDFFGPGADWAGRRPLTMRSGIGLGWYTLVGRD